MRRPSSPSSLPPAAAALLLLTGVFFVNFLARMVLGPLLLPISQGLGISLAGAAQSFVALSLGYATAVFGAGYLSSRIGHHRTICLCLVLLGGSLLALARTTSLEGLLFWVLIMGIGAGLYIPSGIASITAIVPPSGWSRAFAVHEMAPNLAFVLAPFVVQAASRFNNTALAFAWLGWASLVLALVYVWRGPRITQKGVAPHLETLQPLFCNPSLWAVTLLFIFTVGLEVGVYGTIPAYLVQDRGLSEATANTFLGASRLVSLFVLPWMGWVSDRLGLVRTLALCLGGLGLTTCVAGWGPLAVSLIVLTLQPLFAVCFFPVGFAVLALVTPRGSSDLSVSITVTCTSLLGSGVLPALLAALGERWGFAWAFTAMGGGSLLASIWAMRHLQQQGIGERL